VIAAVIIGAYARPADLARESGGTKVRSISG